jgi:hypothetical protein
MHNIHEQYLEFFGPGKSDSLLSMLDDLAAG